MSILKLGLLAVLFSLGIVTFAYWQWFRAPLQGHVTLTQTINPADFPLDLETHQLTSQDGLQLAGYSAIQENPRGWIILVHGFTPNGWKSMLPPAEFLYEQGFNVFILSLRSYGDSEGEKIYLGTREWQDVLAANKFVQQQLNPPALPLGWYGVSLGATSVITAAAQLPVPQQPDFLIAQVPFVTIQSLLNTQISEQGLPDVFFQPLTQLAPLLEFGMDYQHYTALPNAPLVISPTLVVGAERDNQVQFSDSQLLYEKLGTPSFKKWYYSLDTGHDVYSEQPEQVQSLLTDFLDQIVPE